MSKTKKADQEHPLADAPRKPRKSIACDPGDSPEQTERNIAALVTAPDLAAYRVISGAEAKSGLGEQIDVPYLMSQLRRQAAAVNAGDLAQVEAMLMNQATALQSLFARLAERGMGVNDAVPFELNMRMALRAQSQCRATLETLAAIKNPPMIVAKQANVTTGPQQVNNGVGAPSRARKNEIAPNKLLEVDSGERMDTRATDTAISGDKAVAAVEAINRSKDATG